MKDGKWVIVLIVVVGVIWCGGCMAYPFIFEGRTFVDVVNDLEGALITIGALTVVYLVYKFFTRK